MSDLTDEELISTRKLNGLDDDLFRNEKNEASNSMSKNLLGKHVVTYDNHEGIIINQCKTTERNQESVHIQQINGRIWFCPVGDIEKEI